MKPSATSLEAISDIKAVTSMGDLRRIVGNSLLALARKEISATDVIAMGKGLESISNSINAEIKLARAKIELRDTGGASGGPGWAVGRRQIDRGATAVPVLRSVERQNFDRWA